MSEITTIARPYAKAAFDFSLENQCIDKWQNMLSFVAEVVCNQQIQELYPNSIASKLLAKKIITIFANEIDKHVQNLILIMGENGRLNILPEVLRQFIELRTLMELTVNIDVISVIKLSQEQKLKISLIMQKRLSRKVKLTYRIDKSIIAGIILRAGDLVIDGSVHSRIKRLREVLRS